MVIKDFLTSIPAAATNPYAFVAYIIVLLAWLTVALKVKRNRELLQNLQKLPEKDRLKAFKVEVQGVELISGMTPEQWLRARIHQYVFVAFLAVCLVVVVITVLSITPSAKPYTLSTGVYSIVDASGFDEAYSSASLTIDDEKRYLTLSISSPSGTYGYTARYSQDNEHISGDIFKADESEYIGEHFQGKVLDEGKNFTISFSLAKSRKYLKLIVKK